MTTPPPQVRRPRLASVEPSDGAVAVVVHLIDGRSVSGLVSEFIHDAPELAVWVGSADPDNSAFTRRVLVPTSRMVYVGFLKRPGEQVRLPDSLPVEPLRIRVSRDQQLDVGAIPAPESAAHAILAVPLAADSPYREFFFFRENILGIEGLDRLGSILVSMGVISPGDVDRALVVQTEKRRIEEGASTPPVEGETDDASDKNPANRLGKVLRDMALITDVDLAQALATKFRLPFVDLDAVALDPLAAAAVPRELIERYGVLPTAVDAHTLTLAAREAMTPEHRHLLEYRIGRRVREVIVPAAQLARYVEDFLARSAQPAKTAAPPPSPPSAMEAAARHAPEDIGQILQELAELASEDDDEGLRLESSDARGNVVVRLAHRILTEAHLRGASDIHIEPNGRQDKTVVRFRVDGDCAVYLDLPPACRKPLVSRIKILAGLDIAERRKAQDGKIKLRLSDQVVELRVAIIPTSGGEEDAVLRILAGSKPLPLPQMGLSARNLRELSRILTKPYGLILCVGPTGSGKTTTLHSMLGAINTPDMKIWTAEDPVEITQPGLRQVQVNPRAGMTFATAMRAFLRADPDVIMVGEMRDVETAGTAVEASLTGHLVLSTLHTNSAAETITRLLDMGLDPFSFGDALVGVLAQRLTRALCKGCRAPYAAPPEARAEIVEAYGAQALSTRLGIAPDAAFELWRGVGCAACGGSGYKGRIALHELLVTDLVLKRAIARRGPIDELRAAAVEAGMSTLVQDGIEKCLSGATDLRQVLAVCTA